MDNLLVNKLTKLQLQSLVQDPPHAILLVGPNGVGKLSLAKAWAAELCKATEVIEPNEKGSIVIEEIRGLYRRTSGKQPERQVVIIDGADCMGAEAQNAFLKLLEEPRQNVTFVLTAPNVNSLLQTITSRLQVIQVGLVAPIALKKYILKQKPNMSPQEVAQLLFIAQGRPATLYNVLNNTTILEHYKQIMLRAKSLISAPIYDRLASVNELTKDRAVMIATLEAMATMTSTQLAKVPSERWLKIAGSLEECLANLAQNGNARAQLVNLFLSY